MAADAKREWLTFWRAVLATTAVLVIPTALDVVRTAEAMHVISVIHSEWVFAVLALAAVGGMAAFLLALTWTRQRAAVLSLLEFPSRMAPAWKVPALGGLLGIVFGLAALSLHPYWGARLDPRWTAVGIGWLAALAAMACARVAWPNLSWPAALALSALLLGSAYRAASYAPAISVSPFSLGWSEATRFYDASLVFSRRIYGEQLPLPILHPALHFLLAIPFAFGSLPIWVHRAWQVVLRLTLTAATAAALSRRLGLKERTGLWLVGLWGFLFLLQGPVYLHLLVPVLMVILGFSARHPIRTLVVVLLASVWAGLSRINWFPVPAMLASALYLLEVPIGRRQPVAYLAWPATWFALGVLTAFASQAAYIGASGNVDRSLFYTSLSSALLWYRLLPNATYPPGILLMILLVSAPLGLVTARRLRRKWAKWHSIRLLGLGAILMTLFAGGLVVSVKIGAGGDLHNLDAFLVCLMLVGSHILAGRFAHEGGQAAPSAVSIGHTSLALLVAVPVVLAMITARPLAGREAEAAAVRAIQQRVAQTVNAGGQVLFITQRQLVTFGLVRGVDMVPDYEIETLMEMAMAGNPGYLSRFYRDLQRHRFDLIVSSPLALVMRGSEANWGEENDVWLERIASPLICEYFPESSVAEGQVAFLVPRPGPSYCP